MKSIDIFESVGAPFSAIGGFLHPSHVFYDALDKIDGSLARRVGLVFFLGPCAKCVVIYDASGHFTTQVYDASGRFKATCQPSLRALRAC